MRSEMKRKFHNLVSTEVVVKADRLAVLVAKEVEYDDLKKKYDELKRQSREKKQKVEREKEINKEHEKAVGGKIKIQGIMVMMVMIIVMIQMMRMMMTQLKLRKQNQRSLQIFLRLLLEM